MLDQKDYRFTFAVIADTHVKLESGDDSAPWKVNELAAGRARWIAREIARYEPRFVIHLGDLVHPVPELPTFGATVQLTKSIFRQHHNRLHVIPGNHDIGDKPNRAMPAKAVRDEWISQYEQDFGASYSSFDQDDIRFILLNNPVLNSGFKIETEQRAWLAEQLATSSGKRIFIFIHYPLFLLDPAEPGNYDNIDEPARADLLGLIREHRVEAVFAGHVHNIFYNRLDGTEFYVLPSTSFVRQDYAELFRVAPAEADENGRDDREKLGFAIVDVYAKGHATHFLRSYGRTLAVDAAEPPLAARPASARLKHPKKAGGSPLGVYLRHSWAEIVALPHNGPNDEFLRKEARNDYPVAALWRIGISHARVPLADLLCPRTRARMADLVAIGHRFTVFGVGVPDAAALKAIEAHADLVDRYESVLPIDRVATESGALAEFRRRIGRPLLLSRIATSADDKKIGSRIELFVSHGFRPDQLTEIEALRAAGQLAGIDGFVIRLGRDGDVAATAGALDLWARRHGCRLDLHLRLASINPAENVTDAAEILRRAVELYATSLAYPELTMMLDTFIDVDRGYFVRSGLIDRRGNLNPAGLALEALGAFLGDEAGGWLVRAEPAPGGRVVTLTGVNRTALILLPSAGATMEIAPGQLQIAHLAGASQIVVPLDEPWSLAPGLGALSAAPTEGLPHSVGHPTLILVSRP